MNELYIVLTMIGIGAIISMVNEILIEKKRLESDEYSIC